MGNDSAEVRFALEREELSQAGGVPRARLKLCEDPSLRVGCTVLDLDLSKTSKCKRLSLALAQSRHLHRAMCMLKAKTC